jgi:hypothetical protein
MSACKGRGSCIQQCGHRSCSKRMLGGRYDLYCKRGECPHNCQLIDCHNFRYCATTRPQEILDVNNGMCLHCAIHIGKLTFLQENGSCGLCKRLTEVALVSCTKHTFCMDCWIPYANVHTAAHRTPLECPTCKESIWKWKGK